MTASQEEGRDDNDHQEVSSPSTRRVPKSISWLLVILILVTVNMWYSSKDLLPMISSFTGGFDDSKPKVTGKQHNFTKHETSGHSLMQMKNNTHEITTSRNHSLSTNSTATNFKRKDLSATVTCNFCQGDGRIFNPSIRLQGEDNLTCGDIKLQTNHREIHENICVAYQSVENLCCPSANWTHFWTKATTDCFHLTNICHAHGKWFYDRSVQNSSHQTIIKHQPTIAFNRHSRHVGAFADPRIHFNVSSATRYSGNMSQCPYSHTPHHVVTQSAYNHMIGEFYVRQLIGLNQWMQEYPPESDQDIQMYIHFSAIKGKLLDGHRLFTGVLPQNNKVDNFLSLVRGKKTCECYQTLAFCGYNRTASLDSTNNQTKNQTFDVTGTISYKNFSNWCHDANKLDLTCTTFNDLRQDLLMHYERRDPTLEQKIREYKRQKIHSATGLPAEKVDNVDQWKIVGLADRKSRRVWLNIDDSVKACEAFRQQKVVCITVNVEETASPEEQLLMHSSLDALVGIHGAQLTQGILLPSQGYIVELLPWIPDWSWGAWVAITSSPTPVGMMFHNTDLNHLGYSLGRDSVPLCKHVNNMNLTEEKECFKTENTQNKTFMWDRRDFELGPDVVTKFISSFLLQNSTNCDSMKASATENDFVLYNAYCSRGDEKEFRTKHYYRKDIESKSAK